ncbi:MAG: hypothetical protein WBA57_02100 [Elainellaceae cyanobacterium]
MILVHQRKVLCNQKQGDRPSFARHPVAEFCLALDRGILNVPDYLLG